MGFVRDHRRGLAIVAALVVALAGGFAWLRDSALVEVREVTVTGASGTDAAAIREALTEVAVDMTTLHVREDALRAVADRFPVIRDVEAHADIPHGLTVEVLSHEAVVALEASGRRTPVAADGTVLADTPVDDLPVVRVRSTPAGDRVPAGRGREAVTLLAAAPQELRARAERVGRGPRGLTVATREGPRLHFGTTDRLAAKWAAVAAVLADPSSAGASYVDVRLPERPVAGDVGPQEQPST